MSGTARRWVFVVGVGLVSGAAAGADALAWMDEPAELTVPLAVRTVVLWGVAFAALAAVMHGAMGRIVSVIFRNPDGPGCDGEPPVPGNECLCGAHEQRRRYLRYDAWTSLILLSSFVGSVGVRFTGPVLVLTLCAFVVLKGLGLCLMLTRRQRQAAFTSAGYLAFLFLISGFAALIYQIVWQRALFAAFGVNVESITVIVSLFMFGLGIGSLIGGQLSSRFPGHAPLLFLVAELGIGLFGLVSLPLVEAVGQATAHGSLAMVTLAIYGLLCLPTMLMGATLPILVGHLHRHLRNVGRSVGMLYCINTLGSAIACFLTADVLFVLFGQQGAVTAAAICNVAVGVLVARYACRLGAEQAEPIRTTDSGAGHE